MEILGLGKTTSHASGMKFGIKPKDRRQHMYIIGQTGTGKSTLFKNMAIQDMRRGHGVCRHRPARGTRRGYFEFRPLAPHERSRIFQSGGHRKSHRPEHSRIPRRRRRSSLSLRRSSPYSSIFGKIFGGRVLSIFSITRYSP